MPKLKLSFPMLRQAPAVVFGSGAIRALGDLGRPDHPTLVLLSASEPVRDALIEALKQLQDKIQVVAVVNKPAGEPHWDGLAEAADVIEQHQPRRIVAVGGGSVLDWARVAWARAIGNLQDEQASQNLNPHPAAPSFWLVPTTCGTGAEAGDVAVFTSPEGRKSAVISSDFLAERVILDARFLESLDAVPGLLAGLACDALSHGVEAGVSLVPQPMAKAYAALAVRRILDNLPADRPPERAERERLMEAGFLGGVAAANCSVGIVHAFAHSVGADGFAHGLANAAALPVGVRFNQDTSAMGAFLDELRLEGASGLLERVRVPARAALMQPQAEELRQRLTDSGYRAEVAERMARDVALRTNPRRAKSDDLRAFVDDVAQGLHQ